MINQVTFAHSVPPMSYPSRVRLIEIVLDFSLQGDFAITHDEATISVAMCPTCDWSVIANNVQAIATDDEHRQLRALFEDASHPRIFTVDATRLTIRGSAGEPQSH